MNENEQNRVNENPHPGPLPPPGVEVVQLLSGVATGNWVDASKKMTFAWLGLSHNMCVVNSYPPRHTEVAVIVDNSALTKKSVSGITAAGG